MAIRPASDLKEVFTPPGRSLRFTPLPNSAPYERTDSDNNKNGICGSPDLKTRTCLLVLDLQTTLQSSSGSGNIHVSMRAA